MGNEKEVTRIPSQASKTQNSHQPNSYKEHTAAINLWKQDQPSSYEMSEPPANNSTMYGKKLKFMKPDQDSQ